MRTTKIAISIFLVLNICKAQETEKKLPGNTTLPSSKEELLKIAALDKGTYKYSVEDYFAKPKQSSFQFSPDGKYFSYREKDEKGKQHVYVKNIQTNELKRVIEETDELIRGYYWKTNTRLIYMKDKGGNENYQIFAVDVDGKNNKSLTPYEKVNSGVLRLLKDQPDYMIIQMNKDNPEIFEPYKLNIQTGAIEKLYENKDITAPVTGYDFDKDGNLKAITKQQNGTEYSLLYRSDEKQAFKEIKKTTWKDNFSIIDFNYNSENPNDAYVISNMESNTNEILLYDLEKNIMIKKIFANETYDAGSLSMSKKRKFEVDYYSYEGEKYNIIPVSETYKKLDKLFSEKFKGYAFYITSQTEEEDKYLIYVTSDKLYGKYYMYDALKNEFKMLLEVMPQLKEEDMAEMKPITFKSRDGLTIHGYITIPKDASSSKKVPLIVNPHGGPYGPRDSWGYNPETQLFASRGYASIQINYRGSGGYGKSFSMAGNKQIGRNMLNDLEDGVAYAKTLGYIDENKIAIYGASYGGLATLGSLVKTPDLYKCGVDYVGVSNLFTFFKSFPPYWKPYLGQMYEQWYDENSKEDQKIMEEVSPALHVDKITKPLFVIQGANDPRVNINESDQVVTNLRNRGYDVPYMVKYNEGHGFGHEENSIELYKTMLGFFAKHLK